MPPRPPAAGTPEGAITDAEWLDRHDDYVHVGIIDVWVWHPRTWVPRVLFAHGRPAWILDLDEELIGFIYAQPRHSIISPGRVRTTECGDVHWPPCPGDRHGILWMPLRSVRLAAEGLKLPPETTIQLDQRADMARRKSARASLGETRVPAVGPRSKAQAELPLRGPAGTAASEHHDKWLPQVHEAFRYDAFPPWTDPDTWWYYCDTCGDRLTGAEIKASVIVHVVATTRPITSTGRRPTVHTRYGGVAPAATEERSAVPDV